MPFLDWLRRASATADGTKRPISPAQIAAAANGQLPVVAGRPGEAPAILSTYADLSRFDAVFQPGSLFSPGLPLVPLDREQIRTRDFRVGWNFTYEPRREEPGQASFEQLRALSRYYLAAMAIETRKDQIEKFDWAIVSRDPDSPRSDAEKRIAALTEFWLHPDGETPFASWLREALHDLLTIDAPAFEIRRTRGGDIIGLDVIDGASIKVLLDNTGRRPVAPAPAYEQIIKGKPWRLLSSDELLYEPRNPRPGEVYGFGPIEQILLYINIGLRRSIMQLGYYTDGNVPEGIISAPAGWNAEQIQQFQEWFDSLLAGNLAERNKILWTPEGSKYQAFKTSPVEVPFEEWLARVICYVYSLPPTALVNQVNRATGETMQEASLSEGNAPLMAWMKRLADKVIQRRMGHNDLEFQWKIINPLDPEDQATMLEGLVKSGIYSINMALDELGEDPIPDGDEHLIYGGTAVAVRLADIVNPLEPVALPMSSGAPGGAASAGSSSPRPAGAQAHDEHAKPSPKPEEARPATKAADPFRQAAARHGAGAQRGAPRSRAITLDAEGWALLRKAGVRRSRSGLGISR